MRCPGSACGRAEREAHLELLISSCAAIVRMGRRWVRLKQHRPIPSQLRHPQLPSPGDPYRPLPRQGNRVLNPVRNDDACVVSIGQARAGTTLKNWLGYR